MSNELKTAHAEMQKTHDAVRAAHAKLKRAGAKLQTICRKLVWRPREALHRQRGRPAVWTEGEGAALMKQAFILHHDKGIYIATALRRASKGTRWEGEDKQRELQARFQEWFHDNPYNFAGRQRDVRNAERACLRAKEAFEAAIAGNKAAVEKMRRIARSIREGV
jgi:hypothetical protein